MKTRTVRSKRSRRRTFASLVLVIAVFGTIALIILFFCLKFTGIMGSYHEQRSAIEAAALAAAKDLSAMVVPNTTFGYIGLSDSSPIGSTTAAGDQYDTPVTSINTLLGTIRLDLIISDYLEDPLMKQLVLADYASAMNAQQQLVSALNAAVASGGTGTDCNGNILNPTADAITAYTANKVHLVAGQQCTLVPGSLKLSLGYVDGLATRTGIPQPQSVAQVSSSQQTQGLYNANMVINYTNGPTKVPFVFAAAGPSATLVDFRIFQTNIAGLPYSTPSVVKVDADEQYTENAYVAQTIHAAAAALTGTIVDQRPHPGAFTITFVNGPLPEIVQPGDLMNNSQIQADPTDAMQTPLQGDYPQTPLSWYAMPFLPDPDSYHPRFENVISVAFYDWIKRGGTTVNVQNLINMLQTPMNYGGNGPQQQRFHLTSSGQITNDVITWGHENLAVSNNQYRAISGLGLVSSNQNSYDLQLTDFVRVPGTKGGLHAGEPLNVPGTLGTNPNSAQYVSGTMYENTTWPYEEFLTGSGIRPTYNNEGIAVDLTIRQRL